MNFNRHEQTLNGGHFQKAWYHLIREQISYIIVQTRTQIKILPENPPPYCKTENRNQNGKT